MLLIAVYYISLAKTILGLKFDTLFIWGLPLVLIAIFEGTCVQLLTSLT